MALNGFLVWKHPLWSFYWSDIDFYQKISASTWIGKGLTIEQSRFHTHPFPYTFYRRGERERWKEGWYDFLEKILHLIKYKKHLDPWSCPRIMKFSTLLCSPFWMPNPTRKARDNDMASFTYASAPVRLDDNQHSNVPPEAMAMLPHLADDGSHTFPLMECLIITTQLPTDTSATAKTERKIDFASRLGEGAGSTRKESWGHW